MKMEIMIEIVGVIVIKGNHLMDNVISIPNADDTKFLPSSFFRRDSLLVAWSLQSPSPECFSSSGLPRKQQAILKHLQNQKTEFDQKHNIL